MYISLKICVNFYSQSKALTTEKMCIPCMIIIIGNLFDLNCVGFDCLESRYCQQQNWNSVKLILVFVNMFNFTDLIGLESSSQETEYRLRRGKINGLVYNTEQKLSNLLISFVVKPLKNFLPFLDEFGCGWKSQPAVALLHSATVFVRIIYHLFLHQLTVLYRF